MKTYFVLLLSVLVLTSSCNLFSNYGKKVEVGKSEVFYKGDGVTEKNAKQLIDYLIEQDFFDKKKDQSAQLTYDGEDYIVRLVYDKNVLNDKIRAALWKFQYHISTNVFDNKPVRIALANDKLEDYEVLNPIALHKIDKSIMFYDNSEISKSEVKKLEDFFRELKLAGDEKEAAFFYTKEEGKPVVKIVVDNPATIKDDVLTAFSYWQALMQEKVFDNNSKAKLILTSGDLDTQKSVPKITSEQRQAFETPTTETEQTTENTINTLTTDTTASGVLRLPNN
jgi:hypothetical protein